MPPALSAILAPTVNSYKRLIRGRPRSGATWAPVYITYGSANRTQMIRVPGPGRIENRMVDAAANPYLACAAMLAAGLDGIEHQIDPGVAKSRQPLRGAVGRIARARHRPSSGHVCRRRSKLCRKTK